MLAFTKRMQAEELHVVKCYWCSSYGASFRDILIRKVTLNTVVDNNPTHRTPRSFCVMVNNFIIHYHAVNSLRRKVYTLLMLLASYPL